MYVASLLNLLPTAFCSRNLPLIPCMYGLCIHWRVLLCMCSFLWNVATRDTYFLPTIYVNTHHHTEEVI